MSAREAAASALDDPGLRAIDAQALAGAGERADQGLGGAGVAQGAGTFGLGQAQQDRQRGLAEPGQDLGDRGHGQCRQAVQAAQTRVHAGCRRAEQWTVAAGIGEAGGLEAVVAGTHGGGVDRSALAQGGHHAEGRNAQRPVVHDPLPSRDARQAR